MHTEQTALSSYNRFAKVAILAGIPFFFAMGFMSLLLLLTDQNGLAAKSIFVGMTVVFFGFGWFGTRLLPYVHCYVAASPDGLHIFSKDRAETFHPWADISRFKDRPALQVLDVYGKDGKRLLSVDYYISNFETFHSQVAERARAGA